MSGSFPVVDQTSAGAGNGAAWSSGSKITTSPDELIYGFCMSTGDGNPDPPLTRRDPGGSGNFVADRTVTSTGSYAVTGTWVSGAQQFGCQMVTFKGGQSIAGMAFTPGAVLLTSVQLRQSVAGPTTESRLGLGAADSALHQGSSAIADQDNVATTNVWGTDTTTSAFVKSDNATGAIDAQAVAASFETDGFTLDWTTNDAVANTRIFYLALGNLGPVGTGCGGGTFPTGANFVVHGTFDVLGNTGARFQPLHVLRPLRRRQHVCRGHQGVDPPRPLVMRCRRPSSGPIRRATPPPAWRARATGCTSTETTPGGPTSSGGRPSPACRRTRRTCSSSTGRTPTTACRIRPPGPPLLRFCKGVTGAGPYACATQLNAVDFPIADETVVTGDVWRRYQVTFTTGAGDFGGPRRPRCRAGDQRRRRCPHAVRGPGLHPDGGEADVVRGRARETAR